MITKNYFTAPGHYRIEVEGHLQPEWFGRFGAMRVLSPPAAVDRAVTILQGPVSDQAQLIGILNTLHELHMSLIAITYIGDGASASIV